MGQWRRLVRESGEDIWTALRELIGIAAAEHPEELRRRRDSYAEQLFSLPPARANGAVAKAVSRPVAQDSRIAPARGGRREEEERERVRERERERVREREVEAEPVREAEEEQEDGLQDQEPGSPEPMGYDDFDEGVEELDRELDAEKRALDDIANIKAKLQDPDMSDDDILSLLRRMEDVSITVEILKHTEIGKVVRDLRKFSRSKQVRGLARQLVTGWKEVIEEFVKSERSIVSAGPSQMNAGEHGLPSPPLDAGALLAAGSMEVDFGKSLDGLLDFTEDELSAGSGDMSGQDIDRRPSAETSSMTRLEDVHPQALTRVIKKVERRNRIAISSSPEPEPEVRGNRERANFSNGIEMRRSRDDEPRQQKSNATQRIASSRNDTKDMEEDEDFGNSSSRKSRIGNGYAGVDEDHPVRTDSNGAHMKRSSETQIQKPEPKLVPRPRVENLKPVQPVRQRSPEPSVQQRLEAAKRKLHERYEEAEAAKKSRTVQVMGLHELPKGGPNRAKHHHPTQKPKPHQSKNWMRR